MTKTKSVLGVMMAVLLAGAGEARAQRQPAGGGRGFLNVNVGAQPQQRLITTSESFPLYDETATITSSQPVENGPIFEVSGGYRILRSLGIGATVSFFPGRSSSSTVVATIPDLIFVDRPRTITTTTSGLSHTETGVHLQATWFLPISDNFEIALSGGPSFIRVEQQLTATASVPAGTQNVNVSLATETGTALAINVGVDGSYMFSPQYGVGLFVQYAGGSVDLPSVSNLEVGGLRTGLGFRVRF